MKKLTYSICYIPDIEIDENINYLCFDNKIHIRFKDYKQEEVIYGFEKKLTYLLTYLMNYSYYPNLINFDKLDSQTIIKEFLKTNDIATIIAEINIHSNTKIKGIKLRTNYKKAEEYNMYGERYPEYFPLDYTDKISAKGSLNTFLSKLNLTLSEYLFNDRYVILLKELNIKDINKKFTNRMNKKSTRSSTNFDLEQLW